MKNIKQQERKDNLFLNENYLVENVLFYIYILIISYFAYLFVDEYFYIELDFIILFGMLAGVVLGWILAMIVYTVLSDQIGKQINYNNRLYYFDEIRSNQITIDNMINQMTEKGYLSKFDYEQIIFTLENNGEYPL